MKEANSYILDTDHEELQRLGIQHQIWASEAQHGWKLANFKAGQTILDLGSGPGFCSRELAYIAGDSGSVIAVDKSAAYIQFLHQLKDLYQLNITPILADFHELQLSANTIDSMYCRWAMAWIPNPQEILKKVYDSLKPGGKMVLHEYYDWSTHQTEPFMPNLNVAIRAALKSFKDSPGEINIGRELPRILEEIGMKVTHIRSMSKIALPTENTWNWPKSFYLSYFPRLVSLGYLTDMEVKNALDDLAILEQTKGASLCTPLMVEVIAEKV